MQSLDDDRPLEVIVVEDHLSVRKGLELLLKSEGIRIAGVADSQAGARAILERRRYDVALIDLHLSDGNALTVVTELLAANPSAAVVVYTGATDPGELSRVSAVGVRGFVLKSSGPDLLVQAIRSVAAGGIFLDPGLAGLLGAPRPSLASLLRPREREILDLLAEGLSGEQAADRLFLSPETVRKHLYNAMGRLEAKTRVHAVAMILQERLAG
jgi:DNA-binding NarL/FixJ family response regulator